MFIDEWDCIRLGKHVFRNNFQCLKGQPWYFHYKGWLHTSSCDRSRFWAGVVATTQFWRIWLLHVLETLTVAFCSKTAFAAMARTLRWGSLTLLVAGLRVTKRDTENEDSKPCVSLQPAVLSALSRRESMQSIPHPHHRLIWSPTCRPSLQELHRVWVPLLARSLAPWQSCWCAKLPFCSKTSATPRDRGLVGATSCHGKGASEGGWELWRDLALWSRQNN